MAKYTYMQENGNVFYTSRPDIHVDAERIIPQSKGKEMYRQQVIKQLQEMLKPGSKVYCDVTSVSRSGMSRVIKVLIVDQYGEIRNISGQVAEALHWQWKASGVKVDGCGMDMRFHLVYTLSRVLFQETDGPDAGYLLKQESI